MDDTTSLSDSFSDNSFDSDYDGNFDDAFGNDALFDSIAYDGDGGDDDDDVCEDNDFLTSETALSDHDSFGSQQDCIEDCEHQSDAFGCQGGSDQDDIEHQQEQQVSGKSQGQSRRSSSGSLLDAKRRRSEYAARRCKSVDIMTERLMTQTDKYNNNNRSRIRRRLCYACLVIGVLAIAVATIWILTPAMHQQQQQPLEQETSVETTVPQVPPVSSVNSVLSETTIAPPSSFHNESPKPVNVPFANQHNLNFDGLLFVKTSTSSKHHGSYSETPAFDSYAKTLDPITELHFEPGESNTTKQIVLTTTDPVTQTKRIHQNPEELLEDDPGLVLSIGLEANGELWLPQNTGQKIAHINPSSLRTPRHHSHKTITKNIYGPGDRFVLTISEDAITLYRNDYHELVGMWTNPSPVQAVYKNNLVSSYASPPQSQALYAQIWFKEEDSSMLATAWHDYKLEKASNGFH